jgi:hypothetical protein
MGFPQGLKPSFYAALTGSAEAAPFQSALTYAINW